MYSEFIAEPDLQRAIIFHGGFCAGLAIGYRASMLALERLSALRRPQDELVAIIGNKSCAADAIQCLTGCTFGKQNFVFNEQGGHVYVLALRPSGRAVRVALRPSVPLPVEGQEHDLWVNWLLAAPAEEVFEVHVVDVQLPAEGETAGPLYCGASGEVLAADYCGSSGCGNKAVEMRMPLTGQRPSLQRQN